MSFTRVPVALHGLAALDLSGTWSLRPLGPDSWRAFLNLVASALQSVITFEDGRTLIDAYR
jgi:hypothetical protein